MIKIIRIEVALLTICLATLLSCQQLPHAAEESAVQGSLDGSRLENMLQDFLDTTQGIMSSMYQTDTSKMVYLDRNIDHLWPAAKDLSLKVREAMLVNEGYQTKNISDLNLEDMLFLLANPSTKSGYAVIFNDNRGWAFYRARLVNARKPDHILGEVDTYFGPSVQWPRKTIVHVSENGQNGSTIDLRWKSIVTYIESPSSYLDLYNESAPNIYRSNGPFISSGESLPWDLSHSWPKDKWASEGWASGDVLVGGERNPDKKNAFALYQYLPYGLQTNFKGGDKVNFKVRATCKDSLEGNSSLDSAIDFTTPIREISDHVVKIKNGRSFKTKTAYAWIDPTLLGRNPNCVVGNAVYSTQGNLYGIITSYLPQNDKELGDNLVITTVQDERMIYLIKYWYKSGSAPSSRAPRTTSFVATKAADRFDPDYIRQLDSDDALRWAALQRVNLESCTATLTPEQQCAMQFKLLRDARNRLVACESRKALPLRNRFGPVQCSMARPSVTLSCRHP